MPVLNLNLKLQLSIADLLEALLTQSGFADGIPLKVEADTNSDDAAESKAEAETEAAADSLAKNEPWQLFSESEDMNSMKTVSAGLAGTTLETPTWEIAPWEYCQNPSTLEQAWSRRAAARRRQIQIDKSRPEYLRYISEVNKDDRLPTHPRTPSPTLRIPKRQFNRKLSKWRQQLHEFDRTPGTPRESSEYQGQAKGSREHPYPLKLFPYLEPEG